MVKTLVGRKKKTTNSLAESMMNDFIKEGLVQQEFDFDDSKHVPENPDDYKQEMMKIAVADHEEREQEEEWFPVYDAIDAAKAKTAGVKSVDGGIDALVASRAGLPAVSVWQEGDAVMVSERRIMFDPLDSDFYEKHFDVIGKIAANMPKGFQADFDCKPGKPTKYIGSKYIVAKDESRESDQTGVETYIVYDAIETLRITPAQGETKQYAEINEEEPDDSGDCIEVDFPAWAFDYMVNAEIGSVSRQERDQIETWRHMIELNGFDTNMIDFGQDEYFSSSPEFGLPCDCVTAKIPLKRNELNESDDPVAKYLDGNRMVSEREGEQSLYRISARAYTADKDPFFPTETQYRYDCWAMSPREAAQIAARNFMGDFNDVVQLARPNTEDWEGLVDDLVVTDEDGVDVTREFQPEFDRLCREYSRQVWG